MDSGNGASTKASEKALGAFLGAAVGDALGWPNEMPARRVRNKNIEAENPATGFEIWHRRSGGRFMPHEEIIRAGEYSDDTQLLLCSARSLLHGSVWLNHLVFKELPAWRVYQRGGGGATNRAVDIWMRGQPPWSLRDDLKVKAYFDAGGNGVAMRIMPHAVLGARDQTFGATARAILLNGICTHGHPRALLGALAYGFVAWQALRISGTLGYGQLVELVLSCPKDWSSFPDHTGVLSEWREEAQRAYKVPFDKLWSTTESEMLVLLEKSLAGIKAGAISIDSKILTDLGCFDRSINGSGTVCAAAAIYVASKYAPDPQNGIMEAAGSRGADTDTLASMAGGLLGVIAGIEWLQRYRNQLQDERYITDLAQRLESTEYNQASNAEIGKSILKPSTVVDRFLATLPERPTDDVLELPDGRKATTKEVIPVDTKSQNLQGRHWKLRTEDGQTLYIKKLERRSQFDGQEVVNNRTGVKSGVKKKGLRLTSKVKAVKLIVRNLERSREFYRDVLGLKVVRESKTLINFGGIISLISREHLSEFEPFDREGFQTRSILCIECSNIQACHDRVRVFIEAKASPMQERSGRKLFRCIDLDGNIVEVFESVGDQTTEQNPQRELL
jgi:ADP-ribosylglycohydrolase/catechol 2,3-dioxygenase-like lactoylglutathione lyase family enzyme